MLSHSATLRILRYHIASGTHIFLPQDAQRPRSLLTEASGIHRHRSVVKFDSQHDLPIFSVHQPLAGEVRSSLPLVPKPTEQARNMTEITYISRDFQSYLSTLLYPPDVGRAHRAPCMSHVAGGSHGRD